MTSQKMEPHSKERQHNEQSIFTRATFSNAWRQLWHSVVCLGVSLVFLSPFFPLLLWNVFSIFFLSVLFNNPLVLLKMCKSTTEVRVLPSGWLSSRNLIYVVSWFTYSQIFPAHCQQASPTHDEAHPKSRSRRKCPGPMTLPPVIWLHCDLPTETEVYAVLFSPSSQIQSVFQVHVYKSVSDPSLTI